MKFSIIRFLLVIQLLPICAFAGNSVVNMSHYDLMRVDFEQMKAQGIIGVIHEATYPSYVRDAYYRTRQHQATRAGLLWGAYHFADASDPVRQADFLMNTVKASWNRASPAGVLLVLDFEKNGHYPGGTMRTSQAVTFVERIHERTGRYPGLYCSEYRIRQMLYAPNVTDTQRRILSNCWLWVANYHHVPRNTAPWGHWTMWQYTGDGVCDLPSSTHPKSIANIKKAERNMFRGGASTLEAFWKTNGWNPSE